ncbi:MAG: orotidine-5'-phosphate decarboxylase [Longispora sp.]|nr:orotidine-5'-phosphate decarboxylase [Longispora sp. (in: high G+C Gram-positive bacteria)]
MHARDRVIVALDGLNQDQAYRAIEELAPHVGMVKVGFELITRQQAGAVAEFAGKHGLGVFFDGKFHDIPQTVAHASSVAATMPAVRLFNVHCMGGPAMMAAAAKAATDSSPKGQRPWVLGVTVLTSMDANALAEIGLTGPDGGPNVEARVVALARLARDSGLDGVVASPREIGAIRAACGPDFLIVTPGIRPTGAALGDQLRVTTPADAIRRGADYLVIGRPILAPEHGTPAEAAQRIVEEIAAVEVGS